MSKITSATVKVMLSHDYNHFEASLTIEGEEVTLTEVDEARKNCNRLCDKAIEQYKIMKQDQNNRFARKNERNELAREVQTIKEKSRELWSALEKAKVKALEDGNWDMRYNYEDYLEEE